MSKLFKLREWLTLDEVSRHLSVLVGEPVKEADLLRLALEGQLTLSVRFVNHAMAQVGSVVSLEDARRFEFTALDGERVVGVKGLFIGDDKVIELGSPETIEEVWDLTMIGAERLDIEHKYQTLTQGPAVELVFVDGPILRNAETFARVMDHYSENEFFNKENLKKPWDHPANFYPAGALPSDSVFVVRTASLQALIERLEDEDSNAPSTSEQTKPPVTEPARAGGRPMSALWPAWVAELAALIHNEGVPEGTGSTGVDQLISAVADRLSARGLEAPTRSTVQPTAKAALQRLRAAGN